MSKIETQKIVFKPSIFFRLRMKISRLFMSKKRKKRILDQVHHWDMVHKYALDKSLEIKKD